MSAADAALTSLDEEKFLALSIPWGAFRGKFDAAPENAGKTIEPGAIESGSSWELAPMLETLSVTAMSLPHDATGAANPLTVRSGSETPRPLLVRSSRPSRLSTAA